MRFDFFDLVRRAETGPLMLSNEFNLKLLPRVITEVMKDYDIRYDAATFVSTDNFRTDEVLEAGYRGFLDTGIYSSNSRRQIKFFESEIKEVLNHYSPSVIVGEGFDPELRGKWEKGKCRCGSWKAPMLGEQ